jgi:hypothetical protein
VGPESKPLTTRLELPAAIRLEGRNTARSGVRRSWHAVLRGVAPGTPVVSEEQAEGRGRGRGAVCAAAHSPVIKTIATTTISSFTAVVPKIPRGCRRSTRHPQTTIRNAPSTTGSKSKLPPRQRVLMWSGSTGPRGWKLRHRIPRCADTLASHVRLEADN